MKPGDSIGETRIQAESIKSNLRTTTSNPTAAPIKFVEGTELSNRVENAKIMESDNITNTRNAVKEISRGFPHIIED